MAISGKCRQGPPAQRLPRPRWGLAMTGYHRQFLTPRRGRGLVYLFCRAGCCCRLRKETVFAVIISSKRLKVKFFALLVITSESLPFRRHPPLPAVVLPQILMLAA